MAIKLGARPDTFAQQSVTFSLPDGTQGKIKYKPKFRTRSEFGEMMDELGADRGEMPAADDDTRWAQVFAQGSESNGKFLHAMLVSWDAEIELSLESLTQFSDELPGGASAILEQYRLLCVNGKLGN